MPFEIADLSPIKRVRLPLQRSLGSAVLVLFVLAIVAAASLWLRVREGSKPERQPMPAAIVPVSYDRISFASDGFAPLRIAGAWAVSAADPRFGGISSLAIDGGELLALTDSGVAIRFPRPGSRSARAQVWELPAGPGTGLEKQDRDTEAVTRDPAGRGWWVAFEDFNQLWLYDRSFSRALTNIILDNPALYYNHGVEALADSGRALMLFAESGRSAMLLSNGRITAVPFTMPGSFISEAAALPDGSVLLVTRRVDRLDILRRGGLDNRLLRLVRRGRGFETQLLARLPLGPLDNVEAMAAEPAGDGAIRLWLMTDNDASFWRRNLLLELEIAALR